MAQFAPRTLLERCRQAAQYELPSQIGHTDLICIARPFAFAISANMYK